MYLKLVRAKLGQLVAECNIIFKYKFRRSLFKGLEPEREGLVSELGWQLGSRSPPNCSTRRPFVTCSWKEWSGQLK